MNPYEPDYEFTEFSVFNREIKRMAKHREKVRARKRYQRKQGDK